MLDRNGDSHCSFALNRGGATECLRHRKSAAREMTTASIRRLSKPFLGQFLFRFFALFEMRKPHAAQDLRGLGELQVAILHDLNAVAPRVEEVEKISFDQFRS